MPNVPEGQSAITFNLPNELMRLLDTHIAQMRLECAKDTKPGKLPNRASFIRSLVIAALQK